MATTTASEWRKKRAEGIEFQLPEYGDVVRIRPIDVEFWFRTGRIPDFLTPMVQKMIANESFSLGIPSSETQKTNEWLDWLNELVRWALVSPRIVDSPSGEDQISIDEISYPDKIAIYGAFGRPATILRQFREDQIESMASVDAAKNNGAAAEQSLEHQAVGQQDSGDA